MIESAESKKISALRAEKSDAIFLLQAAVNRNLQLSEAKQCYHAKVSFSFPCPKDISIMCNFGPYVGRQNFGKNTGIVRKTAKMKKLSKNREKLGSVKGSHSFIATQLI